MCHANANQKKMEEAILIPDDRRWQVGEESLDSNILFKIYSQISDKMIR